MESDRFLILGIGVNKFLLLLKLMSSGLLLFAAETTLILRFLRVLYWNIMGQKSWPPALGLLLTLISSTQAPSWTQPHVYVFGTLPSSPYIQTLFIPTPLQTAPLWSLSGPKDVRTGGIMAKLLKVIISSVILHLLSWLPISANGTTI